MPSYWKHVNQVIKEANIVIEVLDARLVRESRNTEIEEKVARAGKKMLYVINKCDLVSRGRMETIKKMLKPSVFVSSREHFGTTILKKKILELSHGNKVTVGIVGYPNVGKSSLINALAGRSAARTSPESGFTKGMQKVKVDGKITLLDTPGVFTEEKDELTYAKIGAIDSGKIKDPEISALQIIEENLELVCKHYQIQGEDSEEVLEQIAYKLGRLVKGGKPNLEVAARAFLKDWQTGKIRV